MSNTEITIESEVANLMDDMICLILDEEVVGREFKLIESALDDIHNEEKALIQPKSWPEMFWGNGLQVVSLPHSQFKMHGNCCPNGRSLRSRIFFWV